MTGLSNVVPLGRLAGQRKMNGTRIPPSRWKRFEPLRGSFEQISWDKYFTQPLSEKKTTSVFSSKPCFRSSAITSPT